MLSQPHLTATAAIVLTPLSATACGSGTSSSPAARSPVTIVTRSVRAGHVYQPRLGASERVHAAGTTLSVTVTHVIDPLSRSGAALQAGTRAVGVLVGIQNRGPGIYDSSATGDGSVVRSSGTATPVFAAHGVCQTPLRDFDNYITAGDSRHGCVAFAVGVDARVVAVRFSPHGQSVGRAAWATPG